jgi:hypothetical protein
MTQFGFSARTQHRLLKVARTIADLAGEEGIGLGHLAEAIQSGRWIGGWGVEVELTPGFSLAAKRG